MKKDNDEILVKNSKSTLQLSRRDFMKIAATYGLSSTLLAATTLTGIITAPTLAQAANSTYEKRFKNTPKFKLKFGASTLDPVQLLQVRGGMLDFVRDLEERTDGAIAVEMFYSGSICSQLNGIGKLQQGIIDLFGATTQNAASQAPYYNVLDFAYQFPSVSSAFHFLYSPKSMKLLRDPLRKLHNVEMLFTTAELRNITLGLKYKESELITDIKKLKGAKIRVSGTQLGIIALHLLGVNPVPIDWGETIDAMRQGLVDGMESTTASVLHGGAYPVVSQCLEIGLFGCNLHTCMSSKVFDKLGGQLQDAVMESSYVAQIMCQFGQQAINLDTIGVSTPPLPGTCFAEHGIRVAFFDQEQKKQLEQLSSPQYQPEPWAQWLERLSKWAGVANVNEEIYNIAREIPAETLPENVEPRRWWKS